MEKISRYQRWPRWTLTLSLFSGEDCACYVLTGMGWEAKKGSALHIGTFANRNPDPKSDLSGLVPFSMHGHGRGVSDPWRCAFSLPLYVPCSVALKLLPVISVDDRILVPHGRTPLVQIRTDKSFHRLAKTPAVSDYLIHFPLTPFPNPAHTLEDSSNS